MFSSRFSVFIFVASLVYGEVIEIQCPPHCKCDLLEGYRRATCQNHNIIGLEANIPAVTQLLDLSFNQISELTDHIFTEENLLSLQLLNISHNKLSQIHMNAFEGLGLLKTLDLSSNAMQYILINWFWSLSSLEELYLQNNGFTALSGGPLIESQTLKVLDLSNCAITSVDVDAFIKTPRLEAINLSGNYLQELDLDAIKPLHDLSILEVKNNSLTCSTVNEQLAAYCAQKGIRFHNPCAIKPLNNGQFERMVDASDPLEGAKNGWIYDSQEESTPTQCPVVEPVRVEQAGLLLRVIQLSPALALAMTLVYGIVVGVAIGCTVQLHCSSARPRKTAVPKRRHRFQEDKTQLMPNEEIDLSGTTPVAFRKFPPGNRNYEAVYL